MKISDSMVAAINDQIKAEFDSAYIYLAMSAFLENEGLSGMAHWMNKQYKEEIEHAEKFIKYLYERGAKVIIPEIAKPEENYWTEAVVCVKDSSKDSYGPTEISFLEHKFYKLARAANRCKVKNENTPPPGHFTAEIEAMLNVVIRHVRVALKLFGYYHLEPKISTEDLADDSTTFILKRSLKNLGKEITAKGKPTAEGFVVLKGSQISPEADATIPQIVKNERQNAKVDENNILLEDIILPSPSCAAMVVVGKSANGLTSWKTDKNVTLKDFESQS